VPGWQARINPQRVYDFLKSGISDLSTDTLLAGVRQLGAGEFLRCRATDPGPSLRIERWYQLEPAEVDLSLDAAAEQFGALFRDAVRLRLRADVPVGTGLSGGLDSSSIVCTVSDLLQDHGASAQQHTFSACAEDPRFDERRFGEIVVAHTGARAHYTYPDLDSMMEQVRTVIWHQDEPLAGATVFAEWEVFRLVASAGVKVTLDGHGADELLGGYHSFFRPYLAGLLRRRRWSELVFQARALRRVHGLSLPYLAKAIADYYLPAALMMRARRFAGTATSEEWLDIESLGVVPHDSHDERFEKAIGIQALSMRQLLATSLPPQLRSCDRDSMAHSVESRAPFLDYRLVEFALGCADEHKIDDGITKVILRKAMKTTVPSAILTRYDKMGFVAPEYAWICELRPDFFVKRVEKAVARTTGIVTPLAADRAKDIVLRRRPFDPVVWRLITFADWMDLFEVQPN
jgi:asparagine synthase (glutamine-hydrolysing)